MPAANDSRRKPPMKDDGDAGLPVEPPGAEPRDSATGSDEAMALVTVAPDELRCGRAAAIRCLVLRVPPRPTFSRCDLICGSAGA